MGVSITIPTIPARIHLLEHLLGELQGQTFGDFEVNLIVPRGEGIAYRYLRDVYELKLNVLEQEGKGILNAMNLAFKVSEAININLDDDVSVSPEHIERYVEVFERSSEIGLVGGLINGQLPVTGSLAGKFPQFLRLTYLLDNQPIDPGMRTYSVFFNSAGYLCGFPSRCSSNPRSMAPVGMNMAWRREAVSDLILPEFEKPLGSCYESYAAIHAFRKGLTTIISNIDARITGDQNSLSRSNDPISMRIRLIDVLFSPLVLKAMGFELDYKRIERIKKLMRLTSRLGVAEAKIWFDTIGLIMGNIDQVSSQDDLKLLHDRYVKERIQTISVSASQGNE